MRALILTGRTLPGIAQAVWGKVAAAFNLEPGDLEVRVLARTPLSIRGVPDLAEAHRLQAGLQRCGAERCSSTVTEAAGHCVSTSARAGGR